jgi:hypothetical protein
MPFTSCSQELDTTTLFAWIEQIRNKESTSDKRAAAETSLYQILSPISFWFAQRQPGPSAFDIDQVVNDSILNFMLRYVGNHQFRFHSCGHIVRIVGKITTNQRKMACRWNNKLKRAPKDLDGHPLLIESLDVGTSNCPLTLDDPACMCEDKDQIQQYLHLLSEESHKQILLFLIADFTWSEIATKLFVDQNTVRRLVLQMRRILTPHASRLTPHTSSLNPHTTHHTPHTTHHTPHTTHHTPHTTHHTPHTSHLTPHTSTLNPQPSTR